MGLKKDDRITANFILERVSDQDIFTAYHGDFELGEVYNSKFRKDDHPSCGFYVNKAGRLIYNDIATSEKLDCFDFVKKLFEINYDQALNKVAADFGLVGEEKKFEIGKKKKREKKEKKIEIIAEKWTEKTLAYWRRYGIVQAELEREKIFPIKHLKIDGKYIPNDKQELRYAQCIWIKDKCYKKIYTPEAENPMYKWVNNIPIYIPWGIFSLPFRDERVFVVKSQKERIIWLKYFTDVIALQNESKSSLRDNTIEYLKRYYKYVYINTDLDKAGLEALSYYEGKGLIPCMLPQVLYDKEGIKDTGDFVKKYGLKRFEDFLKWKQLL